MPDVCVRSSVAGRPAPRTRRTLRTLGPYWRSQVERVLHVARRMLLRHVQRFEVVPVVFELRAVDDLVAHAEEDVLDALAHLRQRMPASEHRHAAGQRHVERAWRGLGRRQCRFTRVERGFDLLLQRVGLRAEHPPLVGRRGAHGLEQRRDASLLSAQELIAHRLHGRDAGGGRQGSLKFRAEVVDGRGHRWEQGRREKARSRETPGLAELRACGLGLGAAGRFGTRRGPSACFASTSNAAGCDTARSARLLRSSPTPAALRPLMNCP